MKNLASVRCWFVLVVGITFHDNTVLRAQSQLLASNTNQIEMSQPFPATNKDDLIWDAELRRQWTDRATPEASSRTTLRLEVAPHEFLSLIRLDIPFIDKENGDPLTPHLGDIKNRLISSHIPLDDVKLDGVFETTFPSAQPKSLGQGKYQLGPGFEFIFPIWGSGQGATPSPWTVSFKPWLEQNFSVAGSPDFKNIDYTKLELELKAEWKKKLTLKLTPKPVYNWEKDDSGAVIELETDWHFTRRWYADLVLGHGLWGVGAPTTYNSMILIALGFDF
ncbi:MAG TPA: hypothetical protein VMJ12_09945 [Candidatus Acidoferrales bacterium]|nr:hypothetical protein [Candidatus Acidoferrales bacterium]